MRGQIFAMETCVMTFMWNIHVQCDNECRTVWHMKDNGEVNHAHMQCICNNDCVMQQMILMAMTMMKCKRRPSDSAHEHMMISDNACNRWTQQWMMHDLWTLVRMEWQWTCRTVDERKCTFTMLNSDICLTECWNPQWQTQCEMKICTEEACLMQDSDMTHATHQHKKEAHSGGGQVTGHEQLALDAWATLRMGWRFKWHKVMSHKVRKTDE